MENEIVTKLSVLIHLFCGIIWWYFAKDKIAKASEEYMDHVTKEVIEIISLLVLLLFWEPILIGRIYNWCLKKIK